LPTSATPPPSGPGPAAPAVLTRVAFAALLDRSIAAFDRDVALGLVPAPCGRLRRSPRWLRSEIDAWLASGMPARDEWESLRADSRKGCRE
jgi:predicted DNA-binding transcriptional regulator AlpA